MLAVINIVGVVVYEKFKGDRIEALTTVSYQGRRIRLVRQVPCLPSHSGSEPGCSLKPHNLDVRDRLMLGRLSFKSIDLRHFQDVNIRDPPCNRRR